MAGSIRKRALFTAALITGAAAAAATTGGMSRRFAVVEDSMRPTLEDGDWLLAQRRRGIPSRGDIVVFAAPDDKDFFFIKRVIGLPGEHMEISDGQVHIDRQTLAEPWASGPTFPDAGEHIPDDAVWVLGDNRALSSADSRTIGALPFAAIDWKAIAIYWPSRRVGPV